NDRDDDHDGLTAMLNSLPQHAAPGSFTLNSNGTFSYTPAAGYLGSDQFTYHVSDGVASNQPVTVRLTVVVPPPVAVADSPGGLHDRIVPGNLLSNDLRAENRPIVAVLVSSVTAGLLTLQPDGSFQFTPPAGFIGDASFQYRVEDSIQASNTVTDTIHITDIP